MILSFMLFLLWKFLHASLGVKMKGTLRPKLNTCTIVNLHQHAKKNSSSTHVGCLKKKKKSWMKRGNHLTLTSCCLIKNGYQLMKAWLRFLRNVLSFTWRSQAHCMAEPSHLIMFSVICKSSIGRLTLSPEETHDSVTVAVPIHIFHDIHIPHEEMCLGAESKT